MIIVKKISKEINDIPVLEDIDFEVREGEVVGLVGPNGAGKTTLLNIIAGIWPQDSGDIEIDGVTLAGGKEEGKQKIG